jgi:dynein light intermediate chain 2
LWNLAIAESVAADEDKIRELEQVGREEGETTLFIVGSRDAGKTSMILRFLEREERPKPTTALDYTFGRRSRGANLAKEVTHLWELGGGTSLSMLADVPITAHSISLLSLVLVLDLSKPDQLWNTLDVFIRRLRSSVSQVLADLQSTKPDLVEQLRKRAWHRFGSDHPDRDLLDPLPVPLAIVGSKYDLFQDMEPERKKMLCRTLRFVAHTNGASLYFVSMKSEVLVSRARQLLSHLAFGTGLNRTMSMDYTKPLVVPAGSDALGQIGVPSLPAGDLAKINAKSPMELWKQAYCGFFPQVAVKHEEGDPCKDANYVEPDIDSVRALKDQELERYRRESERRFRELGKHGGQHLYRTHRATRK